MSSIPLPKADGSPTLRCFVQSPTLKRTLSEEMILGPSGAGVDRPPMKKAATGQLGDLMTNNPFYSLLGDCYTIVVREREI